MNLRPDECHSRSSLKRSVTLKLWRLPQRLKSKPLQADLVNRLNNDLVSDQERKNCAHELLPPTLALLGVEKGRRGLNDMKPGMEDALKRHEKNMAEVKEVHEQ